MLKRFAVENFRGLRGRTVVDFTKTKKYGFNTDLICDGLINKVLIVGKNGCGKTNLGLALFDIVMTLTDLNTDRRQRDASAYLNGDSGMPYAVFEYEFGLGSDDVVYSYRKISPDTIVYERLELNGRTVFIRDGDGIDASGLGMIDAEGLKVNPGNGRLSVLRFIVNNTDQPPDSVLTRLMDFVRGMLYFRSVQDGNVYSGLINGTEDLAKYIMDHDLVSEFQDFLEDTGGIAMRLGVVSVGGMPDVLVQETACRRYPLSDVLSSGTGSLMLFFYWMKHFDAVTFLYMDEFDAYYHYALSESVLRLVCGMTGFQTVFTSHNVALVSNRVMRPDCCWMMSDGIVWAFPDLTGRELREGHNMEKLLRGGEFDVRPPRASDNRGQAGRAQVPQEDDGKTVGEQGGRISVYSYGTNIHRLMRLVPEDEAEYAFFDIVQVLREDVRSRGLPFPIDEYTDVFLVFDMDPQDQGYGGGRQLRRASRLFTDSVDRGKLYLNYPMLESYKHVRSLDDESYLTNTVARNDIQDYKALVDSECLKALRNVGGYDGDTFRTLAAMNLRKANLALNGDSRLPDNEGFYQMDMSRLLEMQIGMLDMDDEPLVMNTSYFIIYELDGSALAR